MAQVISFADVIRARRRAEEREHVQACVQIIEANLHLIMHLFRHGPDGERPVRARQIRQLSELLEWVVREL